MTKKMSVTQLKELATFKAVSSTGKEATFIVQGDVAVNQENGKEVKLDSIRRSWEVLVEEQAQVEEVAVEEVAVEESAEQASAEEVAVEEVAVEEVAEVVAEVVAEEQVEESAEVIEVGDKVKNAEGHEGIVQDIIGTLVTVTYSNGDEAPHNIESLELVTKASEIVQNDTAEQDSAQDNVEDEQEAKNAERVTVKRAKADSVTRASKYEEMIEKNEPTSIEEKQGCIKKTYEIDGVIIEQYKGEIKWLALGDSGDEMLTAWELLRSKKKGSWHGVYLKENNEIVREVEAGGKFMKDPSKSKKFIMEYFKEAYGAVVEL